MIELLNQCGKHWAEFFGLALFQNTLFLGLIFYVLYLLRNTDALKKYIIAMIGIFKLLLPPFIPAQFLSKIISISDNVVGIEIESPAILPITGEMESSINLNLISLLFIIWVLTTGISLLIPLISTIRFKLKLRDAELLQFNYKDDDLKSEFVKIYRSTKISMPLTIGIFSKKMFVPTQWDNWSSECRKMILHHELAHIKRKDGLVQILQIIVQAVYFFHPLVWILNSRINQYREMACDDASVATKRDSHVEYSRYLVKIAEEMTLAELGCSSVSALIRQKNELLNRVQYQIKEVAMKHISKRKMGFIVGVLLLLIVPFSWTFSNGTTLNPKELSENELVLTINNFEAEEFGKIIGVVKNSKTNKPLKGAKVYLKGTLFSAKTDKKGKFEIKNVPLGEYMLVADLDGFKRVIFKDVTVKLKDPPKIKITLEPVLVKVAETDKGDVPPPKEEEKWVKGKVAKKGEVPPPPIDDEIAWVDYDEPPLVVGGFGEIVKVLEYPEVARKAGVAGTSVVVVQIDKKGRVIKAKIKESLHPDCDKAAIEALKSVKWKPAIKDDKPVKVWISVPVKFRLK